MAHNDNISLASLVNHTFHALVKLVTDLASLAISEAALAKQSIPYILLLLVFLLPLLITFWFSIMGLSFIVLRWLSFTWQFSFFILSAFNLIVLIGVIYLLITLKNNLFFSVTRKQIKKLMANEENIAC